MMAMAAGVQHASAVAPGPFPPFNGWVFCMAQPFRGAHPDRGAGEHLHSLDNGECALGPDKIVLQVDRLRRGHLHAAARCVMRMWRWG